MNDVLTSTKALSEEIRLRLILLLKDREACVCELMSVFAMAQSKLSHHLITLRDAGFLHDEKRGEWNYYRMDTKALSPVNRELLDSVARRLTDHHTIERDKKTLQKVRERMQICC